uniref:VWFD domain-containing protein n=1 Tax=Sarcophilus harrisii TaxID=9305 RepID=A0A7N4P0N7_SARHA
MVAGKPTCSAASTATCWAQGDPHYTTFDGRRYDFMGTCSYTLSEFCGFDDTLPSFSVETKNEHRNSKKVSYVGLVTVSAYSQVVSLARGEHGFARINNQKSRLPVSLHDGKLRVFQSGTQGVIEMDFGLRVTYNWDCRLSLTLPSRFQNEVCGLCGNYNGNPADDFLKQDETLATDAVEFAESWKLDDGDQFCSNDCQGGCPSCTPGQTQHYEGDRVCGMLSLATGPFALCHDILDPQSFLKDCVYDLCASNGDRPSLCRALDSYATACREQGVTVQDWRTAAGCPMTCPPNSQYSPCGSACPPSCFGDSAPADCDSRPCVEGCVCKQGFVLSGDTCVPSSACGCQYQGLVLAPGEEIWGDELCRKRCVCNGKTQQVECKDTGGCPAGERCRVQDGLQGCYPDHFGTCQASGDPHYVSFDGRRFDFMGTCVYLLAGSCGQDANLPSFRVLVENEHRGSQTVSYTRAVRVQARGVEVAVRREHPGRVLVDGVLRYLPHQAAGGQVQIFQSGYDAVIRTDFGLTVSYDWNARAKVKVPISYANALCGLCGNFNKDPKDDFTLRDGTGRRRPLPGCGAVSPGECPQLDTLLAQQAQSKKECGLLKDPAGPFRDCQAKVDPDGFFRDCVYDRCLLPGQPDVGCDNLAAYVAACHAAGATVHPWRTDQFCPVACPAHSHYEECSRGCPASCSDASVPRGCGSECHEGCVCDEGFALSGQDCVPLAQCGCLFQGVYYEVGQSFYPGPGCDSLCQCGEGGVVTCSPSACGPHEDCQVAGGALGCVVVGSATCSASGDPHYTSFDGRKFDFMGTCVYTLVRTCGSQPGLEDFEVLVENVAWGNGAVSVTRVVTVRVAAVSLVLEQHQWKVKVRVHPERTGGGADGRKAGPNETGTFGLGCHHLASSPCPRWPHRQALPGGNSMGKPEDISRKPHRPAGRGPPRAFGDPCRPPAAPCPAPRDCPSPPQCRPELAETYGQERFCGFLTSPQGPLAACHALVSPSGYFDDCVFDLCLGGGNQDILCNSIHAYVAACQAAGGTVQPWRSDKFCPLECPPNSHYELCADTCSLGCSALSAPPNCPGTCSEGCQCDVGFVSDGRACIPLQDCGCYVDGRYYEPNQPVLLHNCSQECTCRPGQGLQCQDHTCGAGQVCEPSDGILGCVTKDPCQAVTCLEQETCQVQNGQGVCVPNYQATCWLWGDPHYHSFDGRDFDFQGTCSYVLAALCGGPSSLPAFTVTTKNENRGNPSVSYVRIVTVTAHGTNISVHKGEAGRVRVNGVLTTLPVSEAGGRLVVSQGPGLAVLETDFGLRVTYDWNWRVEVTLPSSYHGAVCGLCGNMDKDPTNDMAFPNGTLASSIPSWGGSWRVPEWDPFCWDECHGNCPTCEEDKKEQYGGPDFCGPLAPGAGGPFSACHAHIKPDPFFTGCVLDVCLGGGSQDILCPALASYAAACQAAGIAIGDWRTQAKCPYPCGPNSHYELCVPACPPSCPGPAPAPPCSGKCSEGCQCDDGFILSGSVCVAREGGCGCWANGTYHEPGAEFWADASCSSLCRCEPSQGQLLCNPASCGPGQECAILSTGLRGCRPLSSATCQASGDPHYVTLDGRLFDFQGSCEYLLSGTCTDPQPGTETFFVTVANAHRGNKAVTYTRDVTLHVYDHSFSLSSSFPRKLKVDDQLVALPFRLDTRLQAYLSGASVVIETVFSLSLTFNGDSLVQLRVPAPYAGTLCGLCGDYNGDPANDLTPKGGQPGNDPVAFGHSWKVGGGPDCGVCPPSECPDSCSEQEQAQFGGPEACGLISAVQGPLAACHSLGFSPPKATWESVWARVPGGTTAGQAWKGPMETRTPGGDCGGPAVAGPLGRWDPGGPGDPGWGGLRERVPNFLVAPTRSPFLVAPKGDSSPKLPLPPTLGIGPRARPPPPEGPGEGAQGPGCWPGFVPPGETRPPDHLWGGWGPPRAPSQPPQGRRLLKPPGAVQVPTCRRPRAQALPHHPANSTSVNADCSQQCTCALGGKLSCQAMSCPVGSVCQLQGGSRGCKGPIGVCSLSTSLNTFDGLGSAAGIYELSALCSEASAGDSWFRVLADFRPSGTPVTVSGPRLLRTACPFCLPVSGERTAAKPPAPLLGSGGLRRPALVQVRQERGVRVWLSPAGELHVAVDEAQAGKLCGACGNLDGDQSNDGQDAGALRGWEAQDFSPW